MSHIIRAIILTIALIGGSLTSYSSSLCIQNVRLTRDSLRMTVAFDLTWNNSWNSTASRNHDGVWVFAKIRLDNGDWQPVFFNRTGHSISEVNSAPEYTAYELGFSNITNLAGDVFEEVVGIFLYHTRPITRHTPHFENTRLVFDKDRNGISSEDDIVSIRVFGLEMVYVPRGAFEIGDNSTPNRFFKQNSILFTTANNTFDWHDAVDGTPFLSEQSLFPVTNHIDNVIRVMVPGVGRVDASEFQGVGIGHGPWAPFGMTSRRNNVDDPAVWETVRSTMRWQWIEFQFDQNQRRAAYYFVIKSATGPAFRPEGLFVSGSNDGVNWTVVAGHENHANMGSGIFTAPTAHGVYIPIRVHTPGEFNRYRFHFFAEAVRIGFIGMYDNYRFANVIGGQHQMYFMNFDNVIPHTFPSGYESFWVMKYELTQSAWVEFLNTLTFDQQLSRVPGLVRTAAVNTRPTTTGRNWVRVRSVNPETGQFTFGISMDGVNWEAADNPVHVPITNLSWGDMAAFADWAGLRPLTELEFEKMSRGFLRAIPNEFAWGSQMIRPIETSGLANLNRPNEVQNRSTQIGAGNVRISPDGLTTNPNWPMRVGAFAAQVSSRMESGGTFFGIMNTNDNVRERFVNVSTPEGRAFTGEHGDGRLSSIGNANVPNWPGLDSRGTGYRGFFNNTPLTVSCRSAADNVNAGRNPWAGFRGGRTSQR